jgi:predicted porin
MQNVNLKPTLLTLAMAGALVTGGAQADTILWGSARAAVQWVNIGDNPQGKDSNVDDYWDMVNPGSRLGFRGREDLGGGLSAIWEYEFGVDNIQGGNFYSRTTWAGLMGNFGQLTLGRHYSPYYWIIGLPVEVWQVDETAAGYFYLGLPKFQENQIVYYSPVFFGPAASELGTGDPGGEISAIGPIGMPIRNKGLQFGAGIVLNGAGNDANLPGDETRDGVDMWELGAMYNVNPFGVNLAYRRFESNLTNVAAGGSPRNFQGLIATAGSDVWGLTLSYVNGPFYGAVVYQRGSVESASSSPGGDPYEIEFLLQYTTAPHTFRLGYSHVDPDGLVDEVTAPRKVGNIDTYQLGYQYNFSKRTWVFAEYRDSEFYAGAGAVSGDFFGYEYNMFSTGIRHEF